MQRFRTNLIHKIRNVEGNWVCSEEGIKQCISSHFRNVYASNRPQPVDIARGIEHLRQVVDASMREELLQPYTALEVSKTLSQMAPLKSPGPNDRIISPMQSAFVPGRLIYDNILLAFELNHFLNTKTRGAQGWMALKLDISKAYDKVEWSFLDQVMSKLGFPPPFIRLIMLCVSTISYFFMLGGKQFGSLVPDRGLRQGDPLSPYLFLLCTESFSALLQSAEREGKIRGVEVCRGAPPISHLLFADDTLIFCQASQTNAQAIGEVLELYRRASGQEINFLKSSVAFSRNTREDICSLITGALTIRRENKMELYLGLPSKAARSKRELFFHYSGP
ncbi:UNVERIFIED_CONTAM: putative mitochondrial protein, partial [Sesamum latifolium]